jgi:hypothetical protein
MLGVPSSAKIWEELGTGAPISGKQSEGYMLLGWLRLRFCNIFYLNMFFYYLETLFHRMVHYDLLTFLIFTWAQPKIVNILTFMK